MSRGLNRDDVRWILIYTSGALLQESVNVTTRQHSSPVASGKLLQRSQQVQSHYLKYVFFFTLQLDTILARQGHLQPPPLPPSRQLLKNSSTKTKWHKPASGSGEKGRAGGIVSSAEQEVKRRRRDTGRRSNLHVSTWKEKGQLVKSLTFDEHVVRQHLLFVYMLSVIQHSFPSSHKQYFKIWKSWKDSLSSAVGQPA